MKEIDREFFIKHSIDPDNEMFISDLLTEDHIGYAPDDSMKVEGIEEEDWTGSF